MSLTCLNYIYIHNITNTHTHTQKYIIIQRDYRQSIVDTVNNINAQGDMSILSLGWILIHLLCVSFTGLSILVFFFYSICTCILCDVYVTLIIFLFKFENSHQNICCFLREGKPAVCSTENALLRFLLVVLRFLCILSI